MLTLTGHTDAARSVAFSPDGQCLTSGSYEDALIWDATPLPEKSKP
jgi:WD40 repeat protein